jgi:cytochrome P450
MDVVGEYAAEIPTTIIAEMLGIPAKDRAKFRKWSNVGAESSASRFGVLKALPALVQFIRYVRSLIQVRQAKPESDLISELVRAQQSENRLSEDELLAMIVLLPVAGQETTVNLIGNGTLALLENPDQLHTIREQPALIRSAVEELLRYTGPLETATERFPPCDIILPG